MRNFYREFLLKISIPNDAQTSFVNQFQIQNLRVSFSITKSNSWAVNSGVIKVWNLSADKRNEIKNYGCLVELYAGYRDNGGLQVLYTGYTDTVSHNFDLPEIVTALECSDSARYAIAGTTSKGSVSYAAGAPAQQILRDCASAMGISLVLLPTFKNLAYPYGFKGCYLYREIIQKVCDYLSLQPSYQNNRLFIYPIEFPANTSIPISQINESTGMIGIPQRFTNRKQDTYKATFAPRTGYRVNTALQPNILPGNIVSLSSNHLSIQNQNHVVQTVRHSGDTYGPEWISNFEMTVLQ